jgi:hypothetical protein
MMASAATTRIVHDEHVDRLVAFVHSVRSQFAFGQRSFLSKRKLPGLQGQHDQRSLESFSRSPVGLLPPAREDPTKMLS